MTSRGPYLAKTRATCAARPRSWLSDGSAAAWALFRGAAPAPFSAAEQELGAIPPPG
jgi:hypothetical protein